MAQTDNKVPNPEVRAQARDKVLGAAPVEPPLEKRKEESSYSVIAYLGQSLPKNYEGLVFAKWLRTLRQGNSFFKLAEPASYYAHYQLYISKILNSPGAIVRLAVLTEDPDVVFGFSVSRGEILDYVYVHKDARRKHVGKSLVNFDFKFVTHLTTVGMTIWAAKYPEVQFDPFA